MRGVFGGDSVRGIIRGSIVVRLRGPVGRQQTDARRVAKQEDAFASKIAQQQQQIEALTEGLQKVSAAAQLNKPAQAQLADSRSGRSAKLVMAH